MTFPSSAQVFRHEIGVNHRVSVLHGGYYTVAGGFTAAEAERKALGWVWDSIDERSGLWPALARLERAVCELSETLHGD